MLELGERGSPVFHTEFREFGFRARAAVVLRYGYDLDYVDIGAALGSNEQAARQAASAGVRRLRGRLT